MGAGKKAARRRAKRARSRPDVAAAGATHAASLLRFQGGRFEQKAGQVGFPLDAISELQRYQALILEYAKRIWRAEHPDRKRLPRDFETKVRLRLASLRPGSVFTDLVAEPTLALPGSPDLLEQSLDATEDALRQIAGGKYDLPPDPSPELVRALRGIGKNLSIEETVVYRPGKADSFHYGRKEHDAFWKALEADVHRRDGLLLGKLNRLAADHTFTLLDPEGREIEGKFTPSEVWDTLHHLHKVADAAELVWLDATYHIDSSDGRVVKIDDVRDANLFAPGDNKWVPRLMRFAALQPGWGSQGDGERVSVGALQLALEVLNHVTTQQMKEPGLYASPDGGVRMEWLTPARHTVLTVDEEAHFFAYSVDDDTDDEVSEEPVGAYAAIAFLDRFVA